MSIKYIVGLDVALRNVGVSVHDNVGTRLEQFNIPTSNGMNDHDSIDKIVEVLFDFMNPRYFTPELSEARAVVVYIENILFAKHGKGTARAEVTGVIKWNLRQQGIRLYGVEPSTWQSYLFGKHGVKPHRPGGGRVRTEDIKSCVMHIVDRFYNYYTTNDNIADAIGIGQFGLAHSIERKRFSVRALSRLV
jgi:hypothetical protein